MIGEILSGAGSLIGGIIGAGANSRNAKKARAQYQQGLGYMKGTNVEADNAWRDAVEDPTGRDAQLRALDSLWGVADQRGMDTQSRAAFQQAMSGQAQYDKASRDAILQRASMRGFGGSGNEIASQLTASQGGANSLAGAGAQYAAQARQRALQALQGAATVGSDVRQGDFRFQGAKNNATNLANQFNAGMRWNKALGVNSGYGNIAQSYQKQGEQAQKNATAIGSGAGQLVGSAADFIVGGGLGGLGGGGGGGGFMGGANLGNWADKLQFNPYG